ncbi:hypothetical protein AAE478_004225 [Parahypoxylon ruwenzoriense]
MGSRETADSTTTTSENNARVEGKDQGEYEDDSELYQDVVSQFPFLNGYTHGTWGFQIEENTSRDDIVAALRSAFATITSQIPWLGGQMIHIPGEPGSSGIYKPAPWPSDAPPNEIVRLKICDDLLPPMAQIVRAGAPASMLDGEIITPWPSLPFPHGLKPPVPIIAAQANFVRGGLILNMSLHHIAIDGSGYLQIMRLLGTVLSGHDIPAAEIEQANRDRRRVVPLIPRGEPVKDHSYLRRLPGDMPSPPTLPSKWCYFKIPISALPALRKSASSAPTSEGSSKLFSDNDLFCAFCWQRISAVRLARGFSPDTISRITRAIDGRGAVGVPFSYIGHLVYQSFAQLPLDRIVSSPLPTITQLLRRELNAANTTWAMRSYATFLAREVDKSVLMYGGPRNFDNDLGATAFSASVADGKDAGPVMPDSFGPLLGRVRFIRRPNAAPLAGNITIGSIENGAVPIAVCLPEPDIEGLRKDSVWRRYMRYVG